MRIREQMSKLYQVSFFVLLSILTASIAWAETPSDENTVKEQNNSSVMQAFASREVKKSEIVTIEDKTKRLVMFFMGVPLLLMLTLTVALGIAMVIFDKKVFVAHMISAGLSMTLAIAHAIVGIVWFYPF